MNVYLLIAYKEVDTHSGIAGTIYPYMNMGYRDRYWTEAQTSDMNTDVGYAQRCQISA